MKYIKLLISFFLIIFNPVKSLASENLINQLKEGGKIVLIRHAYAPGNGDPDNFSITDCSTQRNLNKNGISQSIKIGNFFKNNKILLDQVLSSEWCRCQDTAFYAFKNFKIFSSLNSFYDIRFQNNKKKQIREIKEFIKKWNSKKNLILVTHYVVINELTNIGINSGEIIVIDKKFNVIGRLKNEL
jgi:phosphohistidine phosphatase SixA